ncbi:MAGUK p55 subfamily member 7 isoform X6 [Mus musculus]|uniref:MAGUK p55 subfamily member 7 isoform X6 n=1 Tax=Mus musculus TaxID=10090 RepID=UPI0003D6DE1D|nr:MAGUK p55 subfamily member 7 isoform X6 [Mus musculus]|eukprot:XP_006526392.1 PREDICTED: MAGUK p55 subfamily member 7 isoform X6 [Mus musculus]
MEVFLFIVWHHFIFMLIFKYLDLISIYFKRYLYKIIILIYSFVWLHLFLSPIHIIQEHTCVVKHCPALSLGFQSQHYRASNEETVECEEIKDTGHDGNNSGTYIAGFRRSFRLSRKNKKINKSMYECKKSEQYDTADVPTYEEVTPYRRQIHDKYRLIVLVGPVGVGLNELKRKLLMSDAQHYGVIVPHTTRARRSQESDGVEYIFISKHLFETDVQNNKFIEYGEYKNNYYGTSIDSVRSVLAKNKVCLLDVQPHTVKHLRTLEFKPYVIFIKPPSIERLRETRKNAKIISSRDDQGTAKPFTEEDFQEMIKSAQIMESQYGHLFDKIIINDDLTVAFNELKTTFDKLETDTHWVPVSWLHS